MFGLFEKDKKNSAKKASAPVPEENFDVLPKVRTFNQDAARMQGVTMPEKKAEKEVVKPQIHTPEPPKPKIRIFSDEAKVSPEAAQKEVSAELAQAQKEWQKEHSVETKKALEQKRLEEERLRAERAAKAQQEKKAEKEKSVSPLKTYTSDVAHTIKDRSQSVADIVLAEQKRRLATQKGERAHSDAFTKKISVKKVAAMVGIVAVVAAGGVGAWFFIQSRPASQTPTTNNTSTIASLVAADRQTMIDTTNVPIPEIKKQVTSALAEKNEVDKLHEIVLTELPQGADARTHAPVSLFLSLWDQRMPGELARTLLNNFTFGTYTLTKEELFMVFTVSSFEQAFAGALAWEKTMAFDISALTGTPLPTTKGGFTDATLEGRDIRILKDAEGTVVLAYLVPRDGIFAVTTSLDTMRAVIKRLK